MITSADRRAAFAHMYPQKKPNIHERRWIEGQRLDGAMPPELRALVDLLARHREDALGLPREPEPLPTDAARKRGRFA